MTVNDLLGSVLRSAGSRVRPPTRSRVRTARRSVARSSTRLALAALLVSFAAAAAPGAAAASNPATPLAAPPTAAVCGPAAPGYASCLSLRRTDIAARSRSQVTSCDDIGVWPVKSAVRLQPDGSGLQQWDG